MANILHHATSILDRFDLVNTAIDCLIKVNDINEKILVAKYDSEFCFEKTVILSVWSGKICNVSDSYRPVKIADRCICRRFLLVDTN